MKSFICLLRYHFIRRTTSNHASHLIFLMKKKKETKKEISTRKDCTIYLMQIFMRQFKTNRIFFHCLNGKKKSCKEFAIEFDSRM